MHQLLEKLLTKRKITSVNELNPEEAEQFDKWQKILSEGDMSVEKIKDFCSMQLNIIKGQMKNLDNTPLKNERLTILFSIYDTLITLITSPEAERESLEKYLNQLLIIQ